MYAHSTCYHPVSRDVAAGTTAATSTFVVIVAVVTAGGRVVSIVVDGKMRRVIQAFLTVTVLTMTKITRQFQREK